MKTITDEEFKNTYKPIKNHLDDNASWDGCMFETFGDELFFVKNQAPKTIWTIVENDDGNLMPISGFHFVNRMGYLITEIIWEEDVEVIDPDLED